MEDFLIVSDKARSSQSQSLTSLRSTTNVSSTVFLSTSTGSDESVNLEQLTLSSLSSSTIWTSSAASSAEQTTTATVQFVAAIPSPSQDKSESISEASNTTTVTVQVITAEASSMPFTTSTTSSYDPYAYDPATDTDTPYTSTLARTFTFSAIGSILTATVTTIYYAGAKPATADALNGNRCQYFGIGCPSSTYLGPGAVGSLSAAELAAQQSLSVQECEKTIDLQQATAESYTTTFTSTIWHETVTLRTDESGSTYLGTFHDSATGYSVITSVATRLPEDRVGCCGACYLTYSNVDVLYFPPSDSPPGSNCVQSTGGSAQPVPSTTQTPRSEAPISILVSNGYTL